MYKAKRKMLSLLMALTFILNIFITPVSYADPGIELKAWIENTSGRSLVITSDQNVESFLNDVESVYVNSVRYTKDDTNGKVFVQNGNKITIPNYQKPAIDFKYTEIRVVTSSQGVKEFVFSNPEGIEMKDGLEILSTVIQTVGESMIINGVDYGATAQNLKFALDYEYATSGGSELYNLSKYVTGFKIDGMAYPIRDSENRLNLVLFQEAFNLYDKYEVGSFAIEDYKKRNAHEVIITFKDGSEVVYRDHNYVAPQRERYTFEPSQDSETLRNSAKAYILKEDKSGASVANTLVDNKVQIKKSATPLGMMLAADFTLKFNPITVGGATAYIENVKVEAMDRTIETTKVEGERSAFTFKAPRFLVKGEDSVSDLEVKIEFTLSETLPGNEITQNAVLLFDWDNNFVLPGANSSNMASRFNVTSVAVVEEYETKILTISTSPELTSEDKNNIESVIINNTEYPISDFQFRRFDKKLVSYVETVASKAEENPLTLSLKFTDGSLATYTNNNSNAQTYKVTYEFRGNVPSGEVVPAEVSNLASGASITIPQDKEITRAEGVYKLVWDRSKTAIANENVTVVGTWTFTPAQAGNTVAAKYQISNVEVTRYDELQVTTNPEFERGDINKIEKLVVNGTEFNPPFDTMRINYAGYILLSKIGTDAAIVEKAKERTPVSIIIKFNDGSQLKANTDNAPSTQTYKVTYQFRGNVPSGEVVPAEVSNLASGASITIPQDKEITRAEGVYKLVWDRSKTAIANENVTVVGTWTFTPAQTGGNVASKYQVTNVRITDYNELEIAVTPNFERSDINKIEKLVVNGTEFNKPETIRINYAGYILLSKIGTDAAIVEKAKERAPISIIIKFNDGSQLKANTDNAPSTQTYKVTYEFRGNVPSGEVVPAEVSNLASGASITIPQDKEITRAEGVYRLVWDRSKTAIANENVTVVGTWTFTPAQTGGLNLSSNLPNGEYTLTFKAFKQGTGQTETSTLSAFFDPRVKLVVEDGVKKVSLLNHSHADLILDFATKAQGARVLGQGNDFISLAKNVIERNKKGDPAKVEYSVAFDDLTGTKEFAVLGSGLMGGNVSDIGNYSNPNYKKLEIVFDNAVTQGFTEYKVEEDARVQKERNLEILTQALIERNVDTDNDRVISPDELRNATGSTERIAGEMMPNALDLENLGITDISMLKDLGPGIKVLNLNGNKIEELPANLFDNATGITHIYLGANKISRVDETSIRGMKNLIYIDFDGNPLGTLPENFFKENTKIKELSLMNSSITSLPEKLIQNQRRLVSLYLQENELQTLPENFFQGQGASLSVIHLNHNKLQNLPSSIGNAIGLQTLSLNNNQLRSLPETIANIKTLKKIDLSNNNIETAPLSLLISMMKHQKEYRGQIGMDLTDNSLTSFPVDELLAIKNSTGESLSNIDLNLNYLNSNYTAQDREKLEALGVKFTNIQEIYNPQKSSIGAVITAENGRIELEQQFDILELYYWDLGDSTYFGGKSYFQSDNEFKTYLLGEGRDFNQVSRDMERADAIKAILDRKNANWKVETTIVKNGTQTVYNNLGDVNAKEGLKQVFTDNSMRENDSYVLTKTLYVKDVYGWSRKISYSKTFNATSSTAPNIQARTDVPVKAVRVGTDEESRINMALNPVAKVVQKDNGKFEYTIQLKPVRIMNATGTVTEFNIVVNEQKHEIQPVAISNGEYNKAYTFEVDERLEKIKISVKVDAMPGAELPGELVFGNANALPQPQTVKAYILSSDKSRMSKANDILVHDAQITTLDENNAEIKLKFNEMTMGGITAGLDNLWMTVNGAEVQADKLGNGEFKFQVPKTMIKNSTETQDTELPLALTIYPAVQGHNQRQRAILVLDWNNNFTQPNNSQPVPTPQPGGGGSGGNASQDQDYTIPVWLKNKDTGGKSAGNVALVQTAKVEKRGDRYTYKVVFKTVELDLNGQKLRGTVTEFNAIIDGVERQIQGVPVSDGVEYSFETDAKVTNQPVTFIVDVMSQLGIGKSGAILVFDWDGSNSAPNTQNPQMGGGAGGPAASIVQNTELTEKEAQEKAENIIKDKASYSKETLANIEKALAAVKNKEEGAVAKLQELFKVAKIEKITTNLSKGYAKANEKNEFKPNTNITRGEIAEILGSVIDYKQAEKVSFKDISDNSAYAKGVQALVQNNIIKGYADNTFKPEGEITRAEFAAIIARILELAPVKRDIKDVNNAHWAYSYLGAIIEKGIMNGYSDGSFKPDRVISKAEAIVMINRAFNIKATGTENKKGFADVSTSHWAYKDIMLASKNK